MLSGPTGGTAETAAAYAQVAAARTRYVTVVTEDLYQPHNGAAVLRACDGFGVQDVYAVTHRNAFQVDPIIAAGADRWVDVHRFDAPSRDNTTQCLTYLKDRGYRIFATSLRPGCIPIEAVPLDQPIALCFGTEMHGLSDTAHALADAFVRLPMYGFTQSFNISVSVALSLMSLTTRLRAAPIAHALDAAAREALIARWTRSHAAEGAHGR